MPISKSHTFIVYTVIHITYLLNGPYEPTREPMTTVGLPISLFPFQAYLLPH